MFVKITCLLFEHRVVICDSNELIITEAFGICNICQVGVSSLTERSDNQRLIKLDRGVSNNSYSYLTCLCCLVKECLGVAIAVDINISHGIEYCGVLAATPDMSLKPWKNQH